MKIARAMTKKIANWNVKRFICLLILSGTGNPRSMIGITINLKIFLWSFTAVVELEIKMLRTQLIVKKPQSKYFSAANSIKMFFVYQREFGFEDSLNNHTLRPRILLN
jgi:hypothetical protein